jgi:MSHA biogenesis protein MshO
MRRATDFRPFLTVDRGFTLVEMIISIVIAGAVLAMVSLFGRQQIEAYIDVGNRSDLADEADTALRRVARDLQSALPNSVRISGNFLEFVPIRDAGRYRADIGGGAGDNPLDFASNSDSSFDVLGPPVTITAGDQLVIFNLGQTGSDVYSTAPETSRRAISTAPGTVSSLQFALGAPPNQQFPLDSPQHRFQIVGTPVTYECAPNADPALGRVIRHSGYGFSAAQPVVFGAGTSSVLVGDVAACPFSYTPAVLQRNGLVVLRLTLTRNGESVNLLHQVDILNTP